MRHPCAFAAHSTSSTPTQYLSVSRSSQIAGRQPRRPGSPPSVCEHDAALMVGSILSLHNEKDPQL